MSEHLDAYRVRQEGECECGRWSSRLHDGLCPPCRQTIDHHLTEVEHIASAARGDYDDLSPLDGDDDDPPPAA